MQWGTIFFFRWCGTIRNLGSYHRDESNHSPSFFTSVKRVHGAMWFVYDSFYMNQTIVAIHSSRYNVPDLMHLMDPRVTWSNVIFLWFILYKLNDHNCSFDKLQSPRFKTFDKLYWNTWRDLKHPSKIHVILNIHVIHQRFLFTRQCDEISKLHLESNGHDLKVSIRLHGNSSRPLIEDEA